MANDSLYVLARTILDEAENRLDLAGRSIPDRRYVHVGETAWDCDQLTVMVPRVFPGYPGAEAVGVEHRCAGPRTAVFVVELVRCFPTMQESGGEPTMTNLDFASLEILTDGWVIVLGLSQAAADGLIAGGCDDVAVGVLTFPEPSGAMAAARLDVQVNVF